MGTADNKTKPTGADVEAFLNAFESLDMEKGLALVAEDVVLGGHKDGFGHSGKIGRGKRRDVGLAPDLGRIEALERLNDFLWSI